MSIELVLPAYVAAKIYSWMLQSINFSHPDGATKQENLARVARRMALCMIKIL